MKIDQIPQDIASRLPLGQIVLLTSPEKGITYTDCERIQLISKLGKDSGNPTVISSLIVDEPELWGCFAYRMADSNRQQVLVADRKSLIEMLGIIWGIDIEDMKSKVTQVRYKSLLPDGVSHPASVPVEERAMPTGAFEKSDDDYSLSLGCLVHHSKDEMLETIRSIFEDNFNHRVGITCSEVVKLFEEEEKAKERRTYDLVISIEKGEEGWSADKEVYAPKMKCEICLVDDKGIRHPLKLEAQQIALYFTHILFKDGVKVAPKELEMNKDFYDTYKKLCQRIPGINHIPDNKELAKYSSDKRNKIKKAIENSTGKDKLAMEKFAIEGYDGEEYKVAGATDENRNDIRKAFGLE